MLAACYRNSLFLALDYQCNSLAFPSISTGVYGFPKPLACDIAVTTLLAEQPLFCNADISILFCCFSDIDFGLYQQKLGALMMKKPSV